MMWLVKVVQDRALISKQGVIPLLKLNYVFVLDVRDKGEHTSFHDLRQDIEIQKENYIDLIALN